MQLLPKDEKFFDLFVDQANIFQKAAAALHRGASSGKFDEIAGIEKEGDAKVHEILERLNRTFVTPIDPEDISQLAAAIENLLDHIEALAFRISVCGVTPLPRQFAELTGKFEESAGLAVRLFGTLQRQQMKGKDAVLEDCLKLRGVISSVVSQGRDNLRALYETEKDPLRLIKVKDVYDFIETTARRYERFTDVIQNVVAKNV